MTVGDEATRMLVCVAPKYRIEQLDAALVLLSDDDQRVLDNARAVALTMSLWERPRTEDEILDSHPDEALVVAATIADLRSAGVLIDLPEDIATGDRCTWAMAQLLDVPPAPPSGVALLDLGGSAAVARSVARALSVDPAGPAAPTDGLTVVLTDDYLDPALAEWADAARRSGAAWLPARLTGAQAWFGPVITGEGQPCWDCLLTRLRLNDPIRSYLAACGRPALRRADALPVTVATGASLLGLHVASLHSEVRAQVARGGAARALFTFDYRTGHGAWHATPGLPQCASCGSGQGTPWLGQQPDNVTPDPQRRWSAQQARAVMGTVVSPITGVVANLALRRQPPADPVAVAVADYSFTAEVPSLTYLRKFSPKRAAGKGWDALSAEVGALGEALERHSSVFRGDETRRRATFAGLGSDAVHPRDVLLFSDAQYADREQWNARYAAERDARHLVPRRLADDDQIDWSPVWDLGGGRPRWLPTGLVLINHREPDWRHPRTHGIDPPFYGDSNGTGAGATLGEAVWRGLAEAVERDAVGMWWYNRALLPRVAVGQFDSPQLALVERHLRRRGRDLWFLDLTNDLGLPVCAAISARDDDGGGIGFGFSADVSRVAAAEQSAMELLQILRRYDSFEASTREHGTLPERFYREVTVYSDPFLTGRVADGNPVDLDREVGGAEVVAKVAAAGLDILIADVSRPDVPLRVAKVIVPGLRHMWARWAPGRLYDVPVRLGWRPARALEAELNRWPVWL